MNARLFIRFLVLLVPIAILLAFMAPVPTATAEPLAASRVVNCGCRNLHSMTIPPSCICGITLSGDEYTKGKCIPTACTAQEQGCEGSVNYQLTGTPPFCQASGTFKCTAPCEGACSSSVACALGVLITMGITCLECGSVP